MLSGLRVKANAAKRGRCKNLIAVLEKPSDPKNIGAKLSKDVITTCCSWKKCFPHIEFYQRQTI